jgi:ATP-dependent exoDNAse (exonuclease V) beta subunit
MVLQQGSVHAFLEWWHSRESKASLIVPEQMDAVRIMTIHASKGLEFPVVIIPYCNWPLYRAGEAWVHIGDTQAGLPVGVVNLSEKVSDSGLENELLAEKEAQLIDNLNLLYVAFTRAEQRLHIISVRAEGGRTGIDKWIEEFFASTGITKHNDLYSLGVPDTKFPEKEKAAKKVFALQPLHFASGNTNLRIKPPDIPTDTDDARQKGIILHWLISRIEQEHDLPETLESAILHGLILREDKATYEKELLAIIREPALHPYFSGEHKVLQEKELLLADGTVLRPDLVVSLGDRTVVVDYKTGAHKASHRQQLESYAYALKEMGYPSVRKLLVYVDPIEVVEL